GRTRSMVTQVGSVKPSWRWSVVSLKPWAAKKRRVLSGGRGAPGPKRGGRPGGGPRLGSCVSGRAVAPPGWAGGPGRRAVEEPADVEAAFLLVPEHGAHDDAAVVDDGASALFEVRVDRVRRLVRGAGRWVGLPRLSGKGEADQGGDRGGIRCFSRPDAPGLRH